MRENALRHRRLFDSSDDLELAATREDRRGQPGDLALDIVEINRN